ncbi:MAG: winged helix-turn-helix domain-containing protein [Haliea sp.]
MTRQLRFGAWMYCPDTRVLERDGGPVTLEPRVASLLEYFLANHGELLSRDQLVAEVWEGRVVSDDAIRRAVSALRHILAADGSDVLITTVHKKGYLANLPVPLPVAVEAVPAAALRPNPGFPRRSLALLAVVLLFTTLGAVWLLLHPPAPSAPVADVEGPPYTLAVLPFVDLSKNADNGFLADGLAEELLGLLGRFEAFRVPARSSSFQFRDQVISPREVGAALGVRYLVEGSVRRDADHVSVDVRLLEAATGFQLWSENYSRNLAGLFALQSDIATQVARALQVALIEPARPAARALENAGPAGAEAYLEYLRARQLMTSWATADLEKASSHLHNTIALAPDFAPAYTALGETMLMQANDKGAVEVARVRETINTLVEKSMALDPELGEAYGLRGILRPAAEGELEEQDLRQSIALNPTYTKAHEFLAERLFFHRERRDEALDLIDQARAIDPLRPRSHYIKALMMLDSCDHEQAAALAREALRVNPRFRSGMVMLGGIAGWRGELAEAVRLLEEALALDPRAEWVRERLHMAYLDLGELAAAREAGGEQFRARWREQHFLGNHAAAAEMIYSVDPAVIEGSLTLWAQSNSILAAAMSSGDYGRANRFLRDRFSYSGGLPDKIDPSDYHHLVNLLLIWYGPNLDAEAHSLLERLWAEMNATPPGSRRCFPGYQAIAHALAGVVLGHHAQATAILEDAIHNGGIFAGWHWILGNHPGFAPLLEEPRFRALLHQRQVLVTEQREILAQLRAEGVVPSRGPVNVHPAAG